MPLGMCSSSSPRQRGGSARCSSRRRTDFRGRKGGGDLEWWEVVVGYSAGPPPYRGHFSPPGVAEALIILVHFVSLPLQWVALLRTEWTEERKSQRQLQSYAKNDLHAKNWRNVLVVWEWICCRFM